jgi:tetratricopeptide (TPR) repeat protein
MKDLARVAVILITIFYPAFLISQNQARVDSLLYDLEVVRIDSVRVNTLIELSKEYSAVDLSVSLTYAQRALDLAENNRDNALISQSLFNIGYICFHHGLLDMAARHYYKYLDIQKAQNNQEGIINALTNIGSIKLQMMEFEDAKEIFIEVLANFENLLLSDNQDLKPPVQLPTIYNNLGVVYHNLEEYDTAIDYYQRGILVARRMPTEQRNLGNLLNNLGRTYDNLGKFDEAFEAINEALELRKMLGNRHGIASSYRNLAMHYLASDQTDKALTYAYEGLALAEEVGVLSLQANFVNQLYDHYDEINQADSALKYHKLFTEFMQQQNREETLRELTRLELTARFDEQELLRQMEQKRKDQLYRLIAGLLVMIAVIAFLLWYLANSRAKRLQLAGENLRLEADNFRLERQNLEKELEVKNKELTTNVMYQIRKNELINDITHKLLTYSHGLNRSQQELIAGIIRDLERTQDESVWEEFEVRFHQVHNDFYEKLHAINPDLSMNERRLCAFLRLNMTTKEISSITGQSLRSIEVARTRLRKKLHLTNLDVNLNEFLLSI